MLHHRASTCSHTAAPPRRRATAPPQNVARMPRLDIKVVQVDVEPVADMAEVPIPAAADGFRALTWI